MGFNEFIGKLFGNKATRDMKEIKPWVDKVKAVYPEIAKLSNDELRAKTVELKKYISDSAAEEQKKIEELKGTIETTELEDREGIFAQIDKLEKEVLAEVHNIGLGAQFGGKYLAHDIRIIRLPRHGASCPVGLGVSCSADRNVKCKINKDGIWIEKLDSHPGELIPAELREAGEGDAVKINLNQPMTEILKELDKESNTMEYSGTWAKVIAVICICFSLFQIYTGFFGALDAMIQRCIHLSFGISLVYLLCPTKREWIRGGSVHPVDLALAIIAAIPPIYILVNYQQLILRAGTVTPVDTFMGVLGMLMVIEAARRSVGLPIVIVVLCFLAYGFFGRYMPGPLAHRGLTVNQMVGHLFYTTEGVFGIPMGVSSTFIFLFILFGAYLEKTGLGKFFIDIANAIAGWASGGPAKVAVIFSALQGTVSG